LAVDAFAAEERERDVVLRVLLFPSILSRRFSICATRLSSLSRPRNCFWTSSSPFASAAVRSTSCFGVCTCTGGFYDNYTTVAGIDRALAYEVLAASAAGASCWPSTTWRRCAPTRPCSTFRPGQMLPGDGLGREERRAATFARYVASAQGV
jgi:hypothetical protein